MATTTRTTTTSAYGSSNWTGTATNTQFGLGYTYPTAVRHTVRGAIGNIGALNSCTVSILPTSAYVTTGNLYVTTNAGIVGSTYTSATHIGSVSVPAASGTKVFDCAVSGFNGAAMRTALGSATTWYVIWYPTFNYKRTLNAKNRYPVYTFDFTPGSMHVNIGGTWRLGQAHVNIGGTWRDGDGYVNIGGVWRLGGQ